MEKLRKKVFFVILGILTVFVVSILFISNFQNYNQERSIIINNLNRMSVGKDKGENRVENIFNEKFGEKVDDKKIEPPFEFNEIRNGDVSPKIFMDNVIYVVTLDEKNEIVGVTNHSQYSNISEEKIKQIAKNILANNKEKIEYVGNLYFEEYSYSLKLNRAIIIMDNTEARERLMGLLKNSVIVLIILETIIIYVSNKLTNWIIKPVKDSFDKQKQFIADASHELKTPLSVIIGSAEALEKEPNETKWLKNIKEESERMSNLITDLLDMAKSENTEKMQLENENLSKLVEKRLLTFESLIYEKNIKLEYRIEENINLNCNGNQIKQLVGILVDNAIKYSSKDGEIYFNLKKEKNNIVLEVKNKGNEIPKEVQEKIFERFYRGDESRNRGENRYGLGLAIAKNIVENHNGKISVNSSNGYNSFITVIKM